VPKERFEWRDRVLRGTQVHDPHDDGPYVTVRACGCPAS